MQSLTVYPTSSDVVNRWFELIFRPVNTVLPDSVSTETLMASEEVATPSGVAETDESITLQIADEPVITLCGTINESNYLILIDYAQSVYAQGYRHLTLELSHCTNVTLSGLFALFSICTIFRGETPTEPSMGLHGLRQMAIKNRRLGSTDSVIWQNATPRVNQILMKNDLIAISR